MADKIAVMNHGVIEQFGSPQEIYDHPASMYVADFIGSPPMNFVGFHGGLSRGATSVTVGEVAIKVPEVVEDIAPGEMAVGVRPEHIRFSDAGGLRGAVYGVEYLGSTQIVVVETADGVCKARVPADQTFRIGENVGLDLDAGQLSLFRKDTGRAIRTVRSTGAAHG